MLFDRFFGNVGNFHGASLDFLGNFLAGFGNIGAASIVNCDVELNAAIMLGEFDRLLN